MTAATTPRAGRPSDLSGPQKCAILCMALGADAAAKIFQQLSPEEVEAVTKEIASTPVVQADLMEAVLHEFTSATKVAAHTARGGVGFAREVLDQTLGTNRAKAVMERVQDQVNETSLTKLRKAAPEVLNSVLRGEHPQTIALILAHLDVKQAATVIGQMEPTLAGDVLYRVARMEKVSPEMLQLVEMGLSSRTDLTLTGEMTLSGGPAAVAKLLNHTTGGVEKTLLEAMVERDVEVAEKVKNLMFVFEDLRRLDGRSIQRVLREIDGKELALALKAVSPELKDHIISNMSERAGAALLEEMEFLGPVRVKDVEAAHGRNIQTVRSLGEAGEIVISSGGADDDVIA